MAGLRPGWEASGVIPAESIPWGEKTQDLARGIARWADMSSRRQLLSDLLGTGFWTAMQEEHRAGRVPDIFPYPQEKRFEVREGRPAA